MKKLMFSLCVLCMAGAASAQVSRSPLTERAQRSLLQRVASQKIEMQDVQTAQRRKIDLDSVVTQSAYGWEGHSFFQYLVRSEEDAPRLKADGFCNEDELAFVYGTGHSLSWSGTGEIGYRFAAGSDTYYSENYMYPDWGVPYAIATVISRAPSSGLLREDGTYPDMPFYFKLYDNTKVGPQKVFSCITQPEKGEYVDVVYPTDPEQYSTITDTAWIAAGCDANKAGKLYYPADTFLRAEFKDVDGSHRLGDDFCISMVFPIDWDEEGDSILDECRWNSFAYLISEESGDNRISETPHCVYYVLDFQRQAMWSRPENSERLEWLVEDSLMQPNARYAVIPFDSWMWKDGDVNNGEPWMRLYYTEWTALQSTNKADRYVQVSPVPAADYVNFTSYADMSRIEIYSLGGQLVKAVNVSGDTYRLDLAGINSGMYVARIYSEKGISSKKLIVR